MATYEEIYGKRVDVLSSDPSLTSANEGQVWYNSTSGTLKSVVSAATWHSTSNMVTGRGQTGGTGTQTAALIVGGNSPITNKTEEYNGSGFSNGGNLPFSRMEMGVAGPQTAAVAFGGFTSPPPPGANATVEYDGSSWTSGNNMNQGRTNLGSAGTQTAALAFGGSEPNSPGQWTEEYDGTNWSAQNTLGTGRYQLMGNNVGTQTAALCVGGFISTAKDLVEEYDGTNWTATTALPTAGGNQMRVGISTAALAAGGTPGPNDGTKCYSFDGSTWSATASLATPRSSTSGGGSNTAAVDAGAPSNSATSEEFNVSINTFTAAAWASGNNLNTVRTLGGSAIPTVSDGIVFGGSGYTDVTEKYNGTSWTTLPATLNTARGYIAGFGTSTAAVAAGGYTAPNNPQSLVEEFNGSSWSEETNLPAARKSSGNCGTLTAGLIMGGSTAQPYAANVVNSAFEYDGTSWTATPGSMPEAKGQGMSGGTQTAAYYAAGRIPPNTYTQKTAEYNGSSFSEGGDVVSISETTAQGAQGATGTQTAGLATGGQPAKTNTYDGTAWATAANFNTGRNKGMGGGTATAALIAGGGAATGNTAATEEFTGVTETVTASTLTTS